MGELFRGNLIPCAILAENGNKKASSSHPCLMGISRNLHLIRAGRVLLDGHVFVYHNSTQISNKAASGPLRMQC